jgi:hypothetical protein
VIVGSEKAGSVIVGSGVEREGRTESVAFIGRGSFGTIPAARASASVGSARTITSVISRRNKGTSREDPSEDRGIDTAITELPRRSGDGYGASGDDVRNPSRS